MGHDPIQILAVRRIRLNRRKHTGRDAFSLGRHSIHHTKEYGSAGAGCEPFRMTPQIIFLLRASVGLQESLVFALAGAKGAPLVKNDGPGNDGEKKEGEEDDFRDGSK